MLVNILHSFNRSIFSQYFSFFSQYENLIVKENSSDNVRWDLVIVFENVKDSILLECRSGGLVFISGEPEEATSYTRGFIRQFDLVYSTHKAAKCAKSLVPKQYFNDWHFGLNYDDSSFKYTFAELTNLEPPKKSRDISVICSSLEQLPRHMQRVAFVKAMKEYFGDRIDFYGRGFNFIPDKADALLDYKFHICIENSVNKDLWTEKLADPILAYSVPIYSGCPNVNEYFNELPYLKLNIDDVNGMIEMLDELLSNIDAEYQERLFSLTNARKTLLDEHNMFSEIVKLVEQIDSSCDNFLTFKIKSNRAFRSYRVKNFTLRLTRLFRRNIYKILKSVLK